MHKPMRFSLGKLSADINAKDIYFVDYPNERVDNSSVLSANKNRSGVSSTIQFNRTENDPFMLNDCDMKMLEALERKRKLKTVNETSNIIM
jgi:hypothetical protein